MKSQVDYSHHYNLGPQVFPLKNKESKPKFFPYL